MKCWIRKTRSRHSLQFHLPAFGGSEGFVLPGIHVMVEKPSPIGLITPADGSAGQYKIKLLPTMKPPVMGSITKLTNGYIQKTLLDPSGKSWCTMDTLAQRKLALVLTLRLAYRSHSKRRGAIIDCRMLRRQPWLPGWWKVTTHLRNGSPLNSWSPIFIKVDDESHHHSYLSPCARN